VGTVEVRGRQQRAVFATLVRHLHLHLLCNWWQKQATSAPKTNDDTQAGHAPGRTSTHQVVDGWARAEAECGAFGIIGPAPQWIAGSQLTAHSSQLDMDADMTWAGTRTWPWGSSPRLASKDPANSQMSTSPSLHLHLDLDACNPSLFAFGAFWHPSAPATRFVIPFQMTT
jgi:hypothetical protein